MTVKLCESISFPGTAARSPCSLKHLLRFNAHGSYNESGVSIKNDVVQPDNAASVLLDILHRHTAEPEYQSFGIKSNQMDFFRKILKPFFRLCSV